MPIPFLKPGPVHIRLWLSKQTTVDEHFSGGWVLFSWKHVLFCLFVFIVCVFWSFFFVSFSSFLKENVYRHICFSFFCFVNFSKVDLIFFFMSAVSALFLSLSLFIYFFFYLVPTTWNQLHASSVRFFKSSLKSFLFHKAFLQSHSPEIHLCVCIWIFEV